MRPSQPNEVRALSALAFGELHSFPGAIRDMHLGIAERAFRGVGPTARPVQLIHDGISTGVYGAVSAAVTTAGEAADAVMAWRGIGEQVQLSSTRSGSAAIGLITGLVGDRLEREESVLHQPPTVRVRGEQIKCDRASLHAAFPAARPRLVIFLHGLMGTEFAWALGAPDGKTYGSRLTAELPVTAVQLRYNTGLHISENGREVAVLLQELIDAWPVPVTEIALVGHSMGGLVARSACHHAVEDGSGWVELVRQVVTLGTPHHGAPLEQGAHRAAAALDRLPETRMFSAFLRRRSAGIRDLRHGSLVDEDWRGRDPEALRAVACREVPLLPGATYYFVSATVTRDPRHPLGRLIGDILVLVPSATGQGRTRRLALEPEQWHHIGGTHHLALLNHPEVYERLHGWLAART